MLQSNEALESSKGDSFDCDEPTKIAIYLFNCAKVFLDSPTAIQVLPAIKCLYMALSMVLAPQIEVELRLLLGNVLLDHTQNFNDALDQIRKAHQLAESSFGAIKFDEKCRITRSLIDSLIRTNSHQLAQSILDNIVLETLQVQTLSAWHWFIHFSLMSMQLKLGNMATLHQALADIDGILKIIQNYQTSTSQSGDWNDWTLTLASSKVLIMSFLLIVLTDGRETISVFSIVPKASQELRTALNELKLLCSVEHITLESHYHISICTQFFGESLLLMNSLSFSNSSEIADGITNLLNLFKTVSDANVRIHDLKLPGHLLFLSFDDFKLFGDFVTLMTMRQSPCVSLDKLRNEIQRLNQKIEATKVSTFGISNGFLATLSTALGCFKSCLDLESGVISSDAKGKNSLLSPNGNSEFYFKFKEFLLSFTAHFLVNRLGIPKCASFYDLKIASSSEVDLKNLLLLNRSLMIASVGPTDALESNTQSLQILTNSAAFNLIRAIEMKSNNAPAHQIRNVLLSVEEMIKAQMYHEPMIECILYLLLGEFNMNTDLDLSRQQLQIAFNVAQSRLANKNLMVLAAKNLSRSFSSTGDDEESKKWSKLALF